MSTPHDLGIAKGTCIPPEGGWQNQTYYVVDIAWRDSNPVHRAILYVGFVPSTPPKVPHFPQLAGGYTCIMQDMATYMVDGISFSCVQHAYYIKAIAAIPGIGALEKE